MVCNPDNSNICNNGDDKGTELICNYSDKSCVKKVAKSKYRSGFSEALPLKYLNFNLNEFKSNYNHLIILENFEGVKKGEVQRYCSDKDKDGHDTDAYWDVSNI